MEIRKIAICGGGNLGLTCVGVFASDGFETSVLTGHPRQWSKEIIVSDPHGKEYTGTLDSISDNPVDIIPDSDMILLCLPGNLIQNELLKIKPYLKYEAVVGSIVSSTGFFYFAHDIMPEQPLFGFQRVPFISRIREYGRHADLLGYKPVVNVAVENIDNKEEFRKILELLFHTPVNILNNFYEASLTNSNPILHTGRMYSLWGDKAVDPIPNQSLFYADWTDEASEIILQMDAEFMSLIKILGIKEEVIPSLLTYYESYNATSLTNKIKNIPAFKNIKSPMVETEEGWLPDYSSRYFVEDFNFGLRFIKELAEKYNLDTPIIDKVYSWGCRVASNSEK